jgi:glutaredoxin
VASIPETQVVVYHAEGCHLCDRALGQVRALQDELGFALEEIPIDGDPELEARYRELIPVVEIEGEQAFVYHVHEEAFRRRVSAR